MEVYEFPMCCAATVFANFGSTQLVHEPEVNGLLKFSRADIRKWLKASLGPSPPAGNGKYYIDKDAFVCITLNDEQRRAFGSVIEEFGFKPVVRGVNKKYQFNSVTLFVKVMNEAIPFKEHASGG